jgi:hypothetical protein
VRAAGGAFRFIKEAADDGTHPRGASLWIVSGDRRPCVAQAEAWSLWSCRFDAPCLGEIVRPPLGVVVQELRGLSLIRQTSVMRVGTPDGEKRNSQTSSP